MDIKTFPKLTKLEKDILDHRLEVPECIAQVLGPEGSNEYAKADTEVVADLILNGKLRDAMEINEKLTADVLQEAIEGGTYYATTYSESPQKRAAVYRACESLSEKISIFIGRKVYYPGY